MAPQQPANPLFDGLRSRYRRTSWDKNGERLATILFLGYAVYLLFFLLRYFAPLSSFDGATAIFGSAAVTLFWQVAKKHIKQLWRWLRVLLGLGSSALKKLVPKRISPWWLIPQMVAAYPLGLLYLHYQPVELKEDQGGGAKLCAKTAYYQEAFLSVAPHAPQGNAPVHECLDAFARKYVRVTIRRGVFPEHSSETLNLVATNGLIGFIVFPKKSPQSFHLHGFPLNNEETHSPFSQPAQSTVLFDLPSLFGAAKDFEAFVALEGYQGEAVTLAASIGDSNDVRLIDVVIP